MSSPLILAVPSKGRLEENARAFFQRAGLSLTRARGVRDYRGTINGVADVLVAYLSAAEIAREIATGSVHLGVTGEDLIHESIPAPEKQVEVLTRLGFGETSVVVAVPDAWIDVSTMDDLDDVAHTFRTRYGWRMRVASKYVNLTRRFFAAAGIADYRIVESLGATEGAPAAGAAEIIVDITTTGATLVANGLKVLDDGVIMKSEACLAASLNASWDDNARSALKHILDLVAAETHARKMCMIEADIAPDRDAAAKFVAGLSDKDAVRVISREGDGLKLLAPRSSVYELASRLKAAGAAHVMVVTQDYVFEKVNPLMDRLDKRLANGTEAS